MFVGPFEVGRVEFVGVGAGEAVADEGWRDETVGRPHELVIRTTASVNPIDKIVANRLCVMQIPSLQALRLPTIGHIGP